MHPSLGYLRKLAVLGAVVAAGWTWADTLKWSWASKEWTGGLWASAPDTRGKSVNIGAHDVETSAERQQREVQLKTGLVDDLRGVKREVVGDRRSLRGKEIGAGPRDLPPGFEDYTPRDACLQQKLEQPERFGDVDCMSEKYDSPEPWFKAPTRGNAPAEELGE